ncbi:hypothetical protein L208DRAFT_1382739 [Tricholoma matsutake]|nr:hypothetical protein L208DRAFT_1382739 [Tricholoma matsutake 945]
MTHARKYFSHSQRASNNKLALNPELKFLYVTPKTKAAAEKRAKANERQRESRKRKKEEKKRGESIVNEPEGSDDAELIAKKVKQAQKITVYIHIWAPAPRTKSRMKVPESKEIIKGPCFFTVDQDYDTFKEWHYEKLANDGQKPLSSLVGYEAMTTSLLECKRDYIVLIMIPLPSKDEEDWDTGEEDYVVKQYDHYEEIAASQVPGDLNELSVKAQMAVTKDGVTLLSPPHSNFFDMKQVLKPSCTAHVEANEAEGDASPPNAPVLIPPPPALALTVPPFPQLPHWGYGYPPLPPNFPHVPGHLGHPLALPLCS